ncbi:MAG TPA: SRPBCC domain-containing protein [Terricaulis sp.]|mgnify:CR=1 FL=1|nr:SRPBCC domain-containing protein [Terricaulis sp.]HRP09962.1 SRPBCC domain-containing protein [Terricaulis sp.]
MSASVLVSLRIAAPPQAVFDAFTQDIALWWRANPMLQLTPRGDGELRFEPGEGGRLMTTLAGGKEFEIGRITTWAPPHVLAFTWRQATFPPDRVTNVEVRFEPIGEGTRVSVTHSGWDAIPQDHVARHGFPLVLIQQRQGAQWRAGMAALSAGLG